MNKRDHHSACRAGRRIRPLAGWRIARLSGPNPSSWRRSEKGRPSINSSYLARLIVILLGLNHYSLAQTETEWTHAYGGSDHDQGYSVQQTADGGFVVAGSTNSFGPRHSSSEVYLIRTDAYGDTLWTRIYGSGSLGISGIIAAGGHAVQVTGDGGFVVTGYATSFDSSGTGVVDVYLIRTDADGDTLWTRTYGGSKYDAGRSIQQTDDGGFVVAGESWSFSAGLNDVYLIRTDANGDTLWTRTYGGSYWDEGWSVQQTTDGGFVVAGQTGAFDRPSMWDVFLIRTDAEGDTLWTRNYGGIDTERGESVQQTADGGFVVAGRTKSFGAGHNDVYLIRTDTDGDTLWTRTYGGIGPDEGSSVQQTGDGGFVIAGLTLSFGAGRSDVYLVCADANGDTLWTRTYGGSDYDVGNSIQQTTDGGFVVAGYSRSFGAGSEDVWLIKIEPFGVGHLRPGFALYPAYPNPFNQMATIRYDLTEASDVSLVVYDLMGREVMAWSFSDQPAGYKQLAWEGRSQNGRRMPSGIYLFRIVTHSTESDQRFSAVHKMVLLK